MRRSEVVKLIADYLSDYQNLDNELEEADNLLALLEHKGMLPPTCGTKKVQGSYYQEKHVITINKWESEN